MALWRDWIFWLLVVLAVAGLVAGVFPHWDQRVDPGTGDQIQELRFGFWSSPVYQRARLEFNRSRTWNDERGSGEYRQIGYRIESAVNWLSWSSAAILVSLVSLVLLRARWLKLANPHGRPPQVHART